MSIPVWFVHWLESVGIAADDFVSAADVILKAGGAPTEVSDKLGTWVQENVKGAVSSKVILAAVALALAELKGGRPGWSSDHAGLL